MILKDKLSFNSKREYTPEGFLVVPARISRTGIQDYFAGELDNESTEPMKVVRLFRPAEEVFSQDSIDSLKNKTITDDHPQESVDAENCKTVSVGHSGSEIVQDGDFLTADFHITDADTIKKIEQGKVEVSVGYSSDIEYIEGVTDTGDKYDAIQRNIRGNHIAIVEKGRAGSLVKISDNLKKDSTMKVNINDVDFEFEDQAGQAVISLQRKLRDAEAELEKKKVEDEDEEEAKKKLEDEDEKKEVKDMDEMKAKLDDAKSKILTDSQVENLLNDRIKFIEDAKKVSDVDLSGKTKEEIVKAIVADKCPKVNIEDSSKEYLQTRFDILVEDAGSSQTHILDNALNPTNTTNSNNGKSLTEIARDKMIKDSANSWKGK